MRIYLTDELKRAIKAHSRGSRNLGDEPLRVHARGEFPEALFATRFPTEPEEVFAYRRANYRPITQAAYAKIHATLVKIAQAPDFAIVWPASAAHVARYCTENYPGYDDFNLWLFDVGLHAQLIAPNGVVVVIPDRWEWGAGELASPKAIVFEAKSVVWHDEGRLTVVEQGKNTYLYIAEDIIGELKLLGDGKFSTRVLVTHNFGSAPAFMIGGDETDFYPGNYQSVISGCLPYWNSAVLDYSVLNAALHGHVYPEYQIYEVAKCEPCGGKGFISYKDEVGKPHRATCTTCRGSGHQHSPGFGNISIKLDDIMPTRGVDVPQAQLPGPVKQYIPKDFSSIPILRDQITDSLFRAYSAIHMEFLAEVPAAQSGIAKAYDRQYLNTFVGKVARLLLGRMAKWTLYYITLYRTVLPYSAVGENPPFKMMELLPQIQVPTKFDIIPQDSLLESLKTARSAGAPDPVVESISNSLVNNSLTGSAEDIAEFTLVKTFDPLYGVTLAEKLALANAGAISKQDFILSVNLPGWIKYASRFEVRDGLPFLSWPEEEQLAYLKAKAHEQEKIHSGIGGMGEQPPALG